MKCRVKVSVNIDLAKCITAIGFVILVLTL